jgi:hypothetical protein
MDEKILASDRIWMTSWTHYLNVRLGSWMKKVQLHRERERERSARDVCPCSLLSHFPYILGFHAKFLLGLCLSPFLSHLSFLQSFLRLSSLLEGFWEWPCWSVSFFNLFYAFAYFLFVLFSYEELDRSRISAQKCSLSTAVWLANGMFESHLPLLLRWSVSLSSSCSRSDKSSSSLNSKPQKARSNQSCLAKFRQD